MNPTQTLEEIDAAMRERYPSTNPDYMAARYGAVSATLAIMLSSPRSPQEVYAAFIRNEVNGKKDEL